jgi:hypothetical protein
VIIASLVLVSLLITTGIAFALGMGAVNQGTDSTAEGDFSTVSGGKDNNTDHDFATIGGGEANTASGDWSTVGGGNGNEVIGENGTIGGGDGNTANGLSSTVGGGSSNRALGHLSTIGGGEANTTSGDWSTIPGGAGNVAGSNYSFAAGRGAQANHNGAFVWADSIFDEDFTSTAANQFLIDASGGVGIDTNSPNQLLVVGDPLDNPLPGNRITIGNAGTPGPEGRSGLNLGEDQDQRAFILWQNDENYLQLGVRNGSVQENDALVVKDRRVGIGTANPPKGSRSMAMCALISS